MKQYAAIRTENPGAQWDSDLARRFGMTKWELLSDGNHIAVFPDHIHGAAGNMALLDQHYVGMTISAGQSKWSGGHRSGLPGWDGNTIITHEMMSDSKFVIPFMKSIANFEAPGGARHISDKEWQQAFDLYRQVIYGGKVITPKPPPKKKPIPVPPPPKPLTKSRTIWGGIVGYITGALAGITALFEHMDNPYAFIVFIAVAVIGSFALYLIIRGRIDVNKIVLQLTGELKEQINA